MFIIAGVRFWEAIDPGSPILHLNAVHHTVLSRRLVFRWSAKPPIYTSAGQDM